MKYLIILFLPVSVFAKEFTFNYKLNGQTLTIRQADVSWDEAYKKAAQSCYSFYKDQRPFEKEYLLDVIDVCANPR